MEVSWPNLLQAWNYIKSVITSPDNGLYIDIKDTSGGETTFPLGNNPSVTLTITNVPPDKVNLLQQWLLDCWNYLDGLYEGSAHGLTALDYVSAHVSGKPIPPWVSYKYVIQGINVFTGNVFQKGERAYEKYLEKNLPGYKEEKEVLDELAAFINQLKSAIANGVDVRGILDQAETLVNWLEKGQITPDRAKQELNALKSQFNSISATHKGLQPIVSQITKKNQQLFGVNPPKPQVINVYIPKTTNPAVQQAIEKATLKVISSPSTWNIPVSELQKMIQNAVNNAVKTTSPTEAYNAIVSSVVAAKEEAATESFGKAIEQIFPAILAAGLAFMMVFVAINALRSTRA